MIKKVIWAIGIVHNQRMIKKTIPLQQMALIILVAIAKTLATTIAPMEQTGLIAFQAQVKFVLILKMLFQI